MSARMLRIVPISVLFALSACASQPASEEATRGGPSVEYSKSVAKTDSYQCPAGYVLRCETRRVGRIRFNSIGRDNIESCSCEINATPNQSPLPGIY